ncbi:MAG: GNAT family N-acetyltransferase [bacterium]
MYTIATARPHDLPSIAAIELAAARLLEGHAPESVLAETTSHEDLVEAFGQGRLWVSLADDMPVGFAHVKQVEPNVVHLDELDVHPAHGRRGIGRRLVMTVCDWATNAGYDAVTLCTFRDVPWNMPFYASLGFEVVSPEALTPALWSLVESEIRHGLDPSARVVMRRACVAAPSRQGTTQGDVGHCCISPPVRAVRPAIATG